MTMVVINGKQFDLSSPSLDVKALVEARKIESDKRNAALKKAVSVEEMLGVVETDPVFKKLNKAIVINLVRDRFNFNRKLDFIRNTACSTCPNAQWVSTDDFNRCEGAPEMRCVCKNSSLVTYGLNDQNVYERQVTESCSDHPDYRDEGFKETLKNVFNEEYLSEFATKRN